MMIELGKFQVESGKLVVSDPCFDLNDVPVMGVLENARNGVWNGLVEKTELDDWGEVCSKLFAHHNNNSIDDLQWVRCDFIIGVDSGQAGIFDIVKYRLSDSETENQDPDADSDWYLACCDITESNDEAGVIDGGVVSRSGMGDGGYQAFLAKDEREQIIGVKIVFIREERF
ncbi:DUF4241 domain-containing protein [Paenibacillus contaminans]|uniref:DUF4241 domain-containing protein n=1 Tax=Paenibacillus contaminans TaxID=450362 RepID=A0A329M6S1_9BACL|nr:DUF4241 domain-containing protein [Paenibacillus contaminans]RAV14393.1 hypothetical protein DQG23_31355 [Paenibacillus contaminans]